MLHRPALEPLDIVLEHDPAIDKDRCGYAAYVASGYDPTKLVCVEGKEPTRWRIQPLTRRHRRYVKLNPEAWQAEAKVMCGLLGVEGYTVRGQPLVLSAADREKVAGDVSVIRDEWMDRADLPDRIVEALAAAIDKLTDPDPLS